MTEFVENHNVKSIRKAFAEKGVFYTDQALAEMLKGIIYDCLGTIDEAYDPTCGSGSLLSVFPDEVKKYGQEIDPAQADVARCRLGSCDIATGDTLSDPAFLGHKFRAIVANYPFSIKWHPENVRSDDMRFSDAPCLPPPSKADYAFILHILGYLADDGCAAVLNFPGILYRGNKEGRIRRWIVSQRIIRSVTLIEGGHFVDTKIATALIVFQKGRDFDKIKFSDMASGKSAEVPYDEILADADASLSPSAYIEPDEKPQATMEDLLANEKEADDALLGIIDRSLQLAALCHDQRMGRDPVELANRIIGRCSRFIDDYKNNRII